MKNKVNKALLEKFLDGRCTPEEQQLVMQWLKEDANTEVLDEIEHDWFSQDEQGLLEKEVELPFEKLEEKISKRSKVISMHRWLKVAASLFLVAVFSMSLYYFSSPGTEGYITKYAEGRKPSVVTLADGSKITLGVESSISYPVKFASNRQVYLKGEAFFDVSSGSEFTVHAGDVTTKTSRSSFNVSAYPDDDRVVVSVVEGEAKVVKGEKTTPLIKLRLPKTMPMVKLVPAVKIKHNEYLAYSKADSTVSKGEDFDLKEVAAWKDGIIYFSNADSAKVLKELERWYGVNIEVDGCLGQKVFNEEFNNQSLDEVLTKISSNASSKLKYTRVGNDILINGPCI